ncbi:aspartate--tRNA ligase [Pseudomonadota bacterium]
MHKHRTHKCSELRSSDIGKEVRLSGWVHSKRDHGGLLFIDLRDRYGITQCVIDIEKDKELVEAASNIRLESVIKVTGKVAARPEETLNPELETGEVEIRIETLDIESMAEQIPFQVNDDTQEYPEDLRLKYRFIDLRRKKMLKNLKLRYEVISYIRKEMQKLDFIEVQTPILTASSPEGARDFLVPSRVHPGKFYALPQAPQQFKQLLMVSGIDKYFQIAPCFRDEDGRADRLLEFYQFDMEMSFATQDDVFEVIEKIMYGIFSTFSNKEVTGIPFPRIPYKEAMLKYGIDKPDLRNPIEICDVTEVFKGSEFSIFAKGVENGMVVRAIPTKNTASQPRSFFDKMTDYAISEGAKGLGYIIFDEVSGEPKGPVAKFLDEDRLNKLKELASLKNGDAVFFTCAKEDDAAKMAGKVRIKLGQDLGLINKDEYKFCWIVDFPMYEINEETGKIDFSHNPFSMPQGGMSDLENKNPLDIIAYQYDVVCNGFELSSGAIRNHKPELMYKAFTIAGYPKKVVDEKFGGMINAFKFGAPPHGGCAPGVDRIIMLLLDKPNLREVIAFPPNGKGVDLMMGAPCDVDEKQLKELHIELDKKIKKDSSKN